MLHFLVEIGPYAGLLFTSMVLGVALSAFLEQKQTVKPVRSPNGYTAEDMATTVPALKPQAGIGNKVGTMKMLALVSIYTYHF